MLSIKEYIGMFILTVVTMIGAYQGYFFTQRHRKYPLHSLRTRLDNLFSYRPIWVWIYGPLYYLGFFSLIFFVNDLRQYNYILFSFIVLLVTQMGFFWFFPVAVPASWRKPKDKQSLSKKLLLYIQRFDDRSNGFPSMHVSAATLVALHLAALWPDAWPWALIFPALIALSALYTKQHFVINILAGAMLGGLVFLLTNLLPQALTPAKTFLDYIVMASIATFYALGHYEFYFFCQRHPAYKHFTMDIFIDHWIKFKARWIWIYVISFYLLFYLIVMQSPTYEYLLFMTVTFFTLLIAHMAFFIFLPTTLPAHYRTYPVSGNWTQKLIKATHKKDGLSNTFPSLHVSSITVLLLHTQNIWPAVWPGILVLLPIIAASTLLVKQHYFVDTLAGTLLGWGIYTLVSAIYVV